MVNDEPKVNLKVRLDNIFQYVNDKVTSWSQTPSNDKYPSEKLVKDSLDEKISKSNISGLIKNDGTVDTNIYISASDECGTFTELQTLINNAQSGDTIILEKDYKNSGNEEKINITKPLKIIGNGHIIDANNNILITVGNNASTTILEDLTFINGGVWGAIVQYCSELTINKCIFINNISDGTGGAIYTSSSNKIIITDSTFINNSLYNDEWETYGGAIYLSYNVTGFIKNCIFANNESLGDTGYDGKGGAIYIDENVSNKIIDCSFINNTATIGSGIYSLTPNFKVYDCKFENNTLYNVTNVDYLIEHQDITGKENISNKTNDITSSSTNTQYPSAKGVYDLVSALSGSGISDFYIDTETDEIVIEADGSGGGSVDIVTEWEQTLSDEKVPSEKLVKNSLNNTLNDLISGLQKIGAYTIHTVYNVNGSTSAYDISSGLSYTQTSPVFFLVKNNIGDNEANATLKYYPNGNNITIMDTSSNNSYSPIQQGVWKKDTWALFFCSGNDTVHLRRIFYDGVDIDKIKNTLNVLGIEILSYYVVSSVSKDTKRVTYNVDDITILNGNAFYLKVPYYETSTDIRVVINNSSFFIKQDSNYVTESQVNGHLLKLVFNNGVFKVLEIYNYNKLIPSFSDLSSVATSGNYNDLSNKPTIPIDVSDLTDTQNTQFTPKSHTHTKSNITDFPTIPSKVSDLNNDSGFITSSSLPTKTSDLQNDGDGTNVFVKNNDSRLTDSRNPNSHTHGNLSNDGKIGTTANLPIITGSNGVLSVGSFGTTANTFAQGNHTHSGYASSSHNHNYNDINNVEVVNVTVTYTDNTTETIKLLKYNGS